MSRQIQMNGTAPGRGNHEPAFTKSMVVQMNGTAPGRGHHEATFTMSVIQVNGTAPGLGHHEQADSNERDCTWEGKS
jgi:hypothetical protein